MEFLTSKAAAIAETEIIPDDPAGAFPELDINMDTIESILESDWQKRQTRRSSAFIRVLFSKEDSQWNSKPSLNHSALKL